VESQTPAKILLVEDDRILQELYLDRFIAAGFNVVQAFDGQEALDLLKENPDTQLILLDIMIPKVSGYDVLSTVKGNPDTKHIPVIIVSALGDIDDQARGLQLGASDYITKGGILPGAVVEKIKTYVLSLPGPAQQ
jgi:DNA-binding response OmpR family regulator